MCLFSTGIEPEASCMLSTHFTTELYPPPRPYRSEHIVFTKVQITHLATATDVCVSTHVLMKQAGGSEQTPLDTPLITF